MKALVVDDDKLICDSIYETLMQVYDISEVQFCYDGAEAKEKINSIFFDVIILDINIPSVNGLQLMKFVQERSRDSVMVMTSGNFTPQMAQIASDFNVEQVLRKPFDMSQITSVIAEIIKKHPKLAS